MFDLVKNTNISTICGTLDNSTRKDYVNIVNEISQDDIDIVFDNQI